MNRALLSVFVFLTLFPVATSAETLAGRVISISDGDTITVLDVERVQHRIRLSGIDAPEKRQPFGERSKQHLASLVFAKDVEVEWHKRDRYQRIVGKVLVAPPNGPCSVDSCPKTLDTSLSQVVAGLAWHYKKYAHEQSRGDQVRYASAEAEAKEIGIGLWQDRKPTTPWEWRHGHPQ